MLQRLSVLPAVLTALLVSPSVAWGGSAGGTTLPCEATQQLDFVIDDDGDGIRDPGETTTCANPVVDTSDPNNPVVRNGAAGPVCLPAIVAQLRGTLTLIADDDAKDNDITTGQNTGEVLTLLIEVRNQNTVFRVADSYTAISLGSLNLGNWDARLSSETKIFGLKFPGALFLTPPTQGGNPVVEGAFDDLGARLTQFAEDQGLVADANDVLPIIAHPAQDGTRKRFIVSDPTKCGDVGESVPAACGELEVEESTSGVASIAVFRVTISFAEKLTGEPAELHVSPSLERPLVALTLTLWLASVALHLDLAFRERLCWAPIYVAPAGTEAPPRVEGFWAETSPRDDGPRVGDAVLRIGERSAVGASRLGFLAALYGAAEPDLSVSLRVDRDGRHQNARLRLVPYQAPWIFAPLVVGLGVSALLIYLRRRDVPGARYWAYASLAYSFHWAAFLSGGDWRTTLGFFVHVVALALTFPLVLRAVQLFDPRRPERARARWPWLFLGIGPLHASWQIGAPLPSAWALPLLLAGYAALVVCLLVELARTYARGDAVVRRQLRWVVLGFYLALAPVGTAAVAGAWEPAWRPLYEWSLLSLLMIPIAATLALTRYNLFDIDRLISSTAAYSLVLVVLLAVGIRAAPVVAGTAEQATDLSPEVVQPALALVLGALLVFGSRAVRPRLERRFFRERFALDGGVRGLRDSVRRFDHPGPMLEELGTRLTELLKLVDCAIYVQTGDAFVPLFVRGAVVPPAFEVNGRLAPLLDEAGEPVDATRWQRWGTRGLLTDLERAQLEGLDARLLLPIAGEKQLAGFAILGEKGSGDVYTPIDRALLEGLFDRVSMQLERFDAKAIQDAERERAARLAGYVPAAVREELLRREPEIAPGEREVSLLFVDVRGYTSLAQGLTPDEIFRVVNAYTTAVSRVIQEHAGWVVEFQGDGLMAVFGAPRVQPHKERSAIQAALDSVRAVEIGIEGIADVPLRVGVGVATGPAYVGNVQSIDRKIWCVIGNTTNLAARLQGMSRNLDVSIVIDDLTHRRGGEAAAAFAVREGVRVKGRSEALRVHVV